MPARKRARGEMESSEPPQKPGLITQLRNMWQFANLMQYIFIFGKAVKIDEDFDIEDLEAECLKPGPSDTLAEIGLALLKFVSSHRGLTPEIFDEYTRRQYVAKAPSSNPYGTEESPHKFADFDIFNKIRVLFQLSQWTLINADRMREKMPETKDSDQTQWRIEELGYDRQARLYFVLDDNRLYRRTDPPPPAVPTTKPKANTKKAKAAARVSKRRKIADTDESTNDAISETQANGEATAMQDDDGFGGRKWECLAVTLNDYQEFIETIKKSKDVDEKVLCNRLSREVLPVIEKAAEEQQRKIARREKELLTMQKMATAKRSSRIASKMDKEKEEQEVADADRKRQADLLEARKDLERQKNMDEARKSRMMTREQRLKEREYRRILHEEELANLSEDSKKLESGEARMSERHLKAEMERKKKELDKLAQEDEWVFDCSKCGVHGENVDDGSHSVACESCNVWQHSACLGISQAAAEKDNFHFICDDCKRREEDAKKPKIPSLKFRLGTSTSPPSDKTIRVNGSPDETKKRKLQEEHMPPMKKFKHVEVPISSHHSRSNGTEKPVGSANGLQSPLMNGPILSPYGQLPSQSAQGTPLLPPPGLVPGARPAIFMNGHTQHSTSTDLLSSPSRVTSSNVPSTTSYNMSQTKPVGSGLNGLALSGVNPFPDIPEHPQTRTPPVNAPLDPFYNSFEGVRPSSSHSTHNIPPPMKNRPSMSPTQGNQDVGPLAFPAYHSTNGGLSSQTSAAPLADGNQASPAMYGSQTPSGGRTSLGGQAGVAMPMSGLSPAKQSPPRGLSNQAGGTPIMPPVAQLSPSPQQQDLHAPVKSLTPEQARASNERVKGQVNGQW